MDLYIPYKYVTGMRIQLITFNVDEELVKYIEKILSEILRSESYTRRLEELPHRFYNEYRRQYRGDLINRWLFREYTGGDVILAILDVDAYVPPLNFVFGVANPRLMICSVYLPRLRMGVSREDYFIRVRKEVFHELGHIFGLGHCRDRKCVMSFSNSIADVDNKTFKYCGRHFSQMRDRGIDVSDEALLK